MFLLACGACSPLTRGEGAHGATGGRWTRATSQPLTMQASPHVFQAGSPFREPLIKFLTRHPSQTVELFMMEATLNDPQWSRMFMVGAGLGLGAARQSEICS